MEEGKLAAQAAKRLPELAKRDARLLAINRPDVIWRGRGGSRDHRPRTRFHDCVVLGIAVVAIGLAISFFAAEQCSLFGTATAIIGALFPAGAVIGLAEADFEGLIFSALLFLALVVAIRSGFLMAWCR